MNETYEINNNINWFMGEVDKLIMEQQVSLKTRERLEASISDLITQNKENKEALDIAVHAIDILRQVSDQAVAEAYRFLEKSLNSSLERMFRQTVRKIRLNEYTRNGQYPQLEFELTVGNGKKRSLKADSGHGLAQIVSLLSVLSLIVITNSRRILVMDEVISGVSVQNRQIIDEIMWTFTEIGFQFIVNEHGFVPKGSKVYHLEMVGDMSSVKESYIEEQGVYLQGDNMTDEDEMQKSVQNIIKLKETNSIVEEVESMLTPTVQIAGQSEVQSSGTVLSI